jgi:hypothetical protein
VDDDKLETPRERKIAAAANAPHPKVPWFLHNAAETARDARKAQELDAARAPVFIVIGGHDAMSIEEWQRQAHARQALHEAERLKRLTAIDVTPDEKK